MKARLPKAFTILAGVLRLGNPCRHVIFTEKWRCRAICDWSLDERAEKVLNGHSFAGFVVGIPTSEERVGRCADPSESCLSFEIQATE